MASSNGKAFHQGGTIMRLHQITVRAAALVIFASCLAAQAGQVTVLLGKYGIPGKNVTVTEKIKNLITTSDVDPDAITTMNALFTDPAIGRVKALSVVIRIGQVTQTKAFPEREMMKFKTWIKDMRKETGVK
jgi:hypothetical protein